ncbi:MAG TPA: hypothetical protein VN493_13950 [Thermoanaerobaculia bacterium]|nr:hypothetical protein [Thermoanaerobaculia bacterium]
MERKVVTPDEELQRENLILRLQRAVSGMTQEQFSDGMGIDLGRLGQYELFLHTPGPEKLEDGAGVADVSGEWGDLVLRLTEIDRRKRLRQGRGAGDLLASSGDALRCLGEQLWKLLLALPAPPRQPCEEDRVRAKEQLPLFVGYTPAQRAAVLRLDGEHQPWALCLEAGEESERAASRDLEEAVKLARIARELAERVEGPGGWPEAILSRALAYEANVQRVRGTLKEARQTFEEVSRLAEAGSDPYGLLDPGTLPDLEASLCRAERRFEPALKLLDHAITVGRCPARALIKKGFTLAVMGNHDGAVKALREAEAGLDRQAEPRLWYQQRFNLSVSYTHLDRHADASALIQDVRDVAAELGDEIFLLRVRWLEGRIEAGLGRRAAALLFLEQAQAGFEKREMFYDVALAALERAGLLLEEGRTAEVKAMALELAEAFESEDVHHEARKALGLFREAAEREAATAELARRVLGFLFRARHDPGLRFGA